MKIKFLDKNKIVALEGDKKIGYLTFKHPNDLTPKRNMEMVYIYVKPKFRLQGIATKMLRFFLNHFKDVVWVSIWTGRQMEVDKGFDLYRKLGFKEQCFQADYYEKGIGTRLFAKRISRE
jgi:ribosomal protein S18 acetylase RimI-like enzyme